MPNTLKTINQYCFINDYCLESITIPASVTKINPAVFSDGYLKKAKFEDPEGWTWKLSTYYTEQIAKEDMAGETKAAGYLQGNYTIGILSRA